MTKPASLHYNQFMSMETSTGTSRHFMFQCFDCAKAKLSDLSVLHAFLKAFPQKINMDPIGDPLVFEFKGDFEEESGVSGVMRVSRSHISIHTFPENDKAFIDIFTSQELDIGQARQHLLSFFETDNFKEETVSSKPAYSETVSDIRCLAGSLR